MRILVAVLMLAITAGAHFRAAAEAPVTSIEIANAERTTERTIDRMLFDSGYFVASIAETEPYMTATNRERFLSALTRNLRPDQADAARAYMSTFDERFNETLNRERPAIVTRVAGHLQQALAANELSGLEQFVLSDETSGLFMRMMQQWINRGGGDEAIDLSGYTPAELSALRAFMQSPGASVFNEKGQAFEAIMLAELNNFVPVFEREFFAGLCAATGQECPDWVRN